MSAGRHTLHKHGPEDVHDLLLDLVFQRTRAGVASSASGDEAASVVALILSRVINRIVLYWVVNPDFCILWSFQQRSHARACVF